MHASVYIHFAISFGLFTLHAFGRCFWLILLSSSALQRPPSQKKAVCRFGEGVEGASCWLWLEREEHSEGWRLSNQLSSRPGLHGSRKAPSLYRWTWTTERWVVKGGRGRGGRVRWKRSRGEEKRGKDEGCVGEKVQKKCRWTPRLSLASISSPLPPETLWRSLPRQGSRL